MNLLVATDLLEGPVERALLGVEETAAGEFGDVLQFRLVGVAEQDGEDGDVALVATETAMEAVELTGLCPAGVLTVGHQHDRREGVTVVTEVLVGLLERCVDR